MGWFPNYAIRILHINTKQCAIEFDLSPAFYNMLDIIYCLKRDRNIAIADKSLFPGDRPNFQQPEIVLIKPYNLNINFIYKIIDRSQLCY